LSIQFILQALIDAFFKLKELKSFPPLKGVHIKEELQTTSKALEKLYLFSIENPISQRGGFVDKICFYSETLMKASQIREPELFVSLEEVRKEMLIFKSKMMVWNKLPTSYPLEEMLQELLQLGSHVFEHLRSFFGALVPFLREARSDENVLVYLIEKKEMLNQDLGKRCIEELLQSFFPAGHDQLRAVIYEGYTRRGFSAFFAEVEPLIDAVQWEMSCTLS
jgi:hypothetical protein